MVKKFKHDTKETNYRIWKSGKMWLYASVALASIAGGAALEAQGITSKVLSYVKKDLGNDVVEALASTPSLLNRGDVLPSDFYATVADFSVPSTVGTDFANNATKSVSGSINPRFEGSTYVIPSADNSNAIAGFNQPLDPTKDFSISAEITVPDARVAAAGIYISDVPSEDIVKKLGTDSGNYPGSSGSLIDKKEAYDGHYMLFSGFHNSGGYVAILASGTAYTPMTKGDSPYGNSKYIDDDYVLLGGGTEGKNAKVWATINYSATTGIATVIYRHNSTTGYTATNSANNGYTKTNKTATVQFKISQSSPVYLGIVGNGDKNDSKGDYTSRSTVTSVTGTYLTKERYVEFKDDASNPLLAPSKVLMPRGGRLGIGNNDLKTPYYFDKPDVPQGYTYLETLNPSVGDDKNVVVKYQRDVQTGLVERVNNLTGQKMDPSKNIVIKGATNQDLSVNVPKISGYYYVNQILGDATIPVYAADGATVDFKLKMDDTPNGTATTDSQEQIIETYMMPSVQERILTINKPDGTVLTEKQMSTTDTDFSPIGGQYVIPGYRAVVDSKPVTDIEMSQGIPGEVTDHTDNLKAATDKTPQTHTITYQAEPQKATIAYQDMTTGKTIKTDTINGISDTMMTYDTASNIASYVKQGYVVKYNNFTDGAEKFDNVPGIDQSYIVELVHDSKDPVETKTLKHEVAYTVKDGLVSAPQDYATETKITYTYFVDKVTGTIITKDFTGYAVNGDLNLIPKAPKYDSDHPDANVAQDGQVTFISPIVPNIQGYSPTVSENTTIKYSQAKDGDVLKSTVLYVNQGSIRLSTVPDLDFGSQIISPKNRGKVYSANFSDDLIVDDDRKVIKDGWHLSVQQTTPLTSTDGKTKLRHLLFFRETDGGTLSDLDGGSDLVIYDYTSKSALGVLETVKPTSDWNKKMMMLDFI